MVFPSHFADNASETLVQVRYDVIEVPITLPSQKPQPDKPNPKQGISETLFIATFYLFMFILRACAFVLLKSVTKFVFFESFLSSSLS